MRFATNWSPERESGPRLAAWSVGCATRLSDITQRPLLFQQSPDNDDLRLRIPLLFTDSGQLLDSARTISMTPEKRPPKSRAGIAVAGRLGHVCMSRNERSLK